MRPTLRLLVATAALSAALASSGLAQQTPAAPAPPHPSAPAASASAAGSAMTDAMDKMQQDMADAPMTGDPDHDFVAMMIPHHEGAVDMAKIELAYGKDPNMRTLARAIIAAQHREMAEMKAWQATHPAP